MRSHPNRPSWAGRLEKKLGSKARGGVPRDKQAEVLRQGISALAGVRSLGAGKRGLPEQPFDSHLLALSPLYRKSREIYLRGGGKFRAALVSSPRTLSSPILLEQMIEYSPIERELIWAATDPRESRNPARMLGLRTYSSSLFHEQSHRILWRMLPPPPVGSGPGLRRYLNFVESLVITLDMALGDELGPGLAATFYLSGVTYDPGTDVREGLSRREYRNYLQAALHATYLTLEMYDPKRIPSAIVALFPMLGHELAERAAVRSTNLDRGFVTRTNPVWQKEHSPAVKRALSRLRGEPLVLDGDPMDNRQQYLLGEKWLAMFGL